MWVDSGICALRRSECCALPGSGVLHDERGVISLANRMNTAPMVHVLFSTVNAALCLSAWLCMFYTSSSSS